MKKIFPIAFALALASASAAHAQVEQSASAGYKSGRLFMDQGLDLFRGPTWTGNYNVSTDDWYLDFTEEYAGARFANETDICLGRTGNFAASTTYDVNACFFEVAGPEVYQLELAADHSFSDEWSVNGRIDVMDGGFRTQVGYLGAAYVRGGFDANLGVSYDTWSRDTVLQGGLGYSFPFLLSSRLHFFAKGFSVLDEGNPLHSDDESAWVGGAEVSVDPRALFH